LLCGEVGFASLSRNRLGVVGARPGAELPPRIDHSLGFETRGSPIALNEACEHGGNAASEMVEFIGLGLRGEAKGGEKLDARSDLAGFAAGFGVALALLASGVAVGALTDEEDGLTGGTEELIGEAAITAGHAVGELAAAACHVERDAVDVEALVAEWVVGMSGRVVGGRARDVGQRVSVGIVHRNLLDSGRPKATVRPRGGRRRGRPG